MDGHSYGGSVITKPPRATPTSMRRSTATPPRPTWRDQRIAQRTGLGAQAVAGKRTVRQVPYPGAPAGAVDLYLKKDLFLHNFGNDLPADEATRRGRHNGPLRQRAFETPSQASGVEDDPVVVLHQCGDQTNRRLSDARWPKQINFHSHRFEAADPKSSPRRPPMRCRRTHAIVRSAPAPMFSGL